MSSMKFLDVEKFRPQAKHRIIIRKQNAELSWVELQQKFWYGWRSMLVTYKNLGLDNPPVPNKPGYCYTARSCFKVKNEKEKEESIQIYKNFLLTKKEEYRNKQIEKSKEKKENKNLKKIESVIEFNSIQIKKSANGNLSLCGNSKE